MQSITLNIDDIADPNAIPHLLAQLGYVGPNNGAAKVAFMKAYLVANLKEHVKSYRRSQAALAAEVANEDLPIN
jgi:hypothetical protein